MGLFIFLTTSLGIVALLSSIIAYNFGFYSFGDWISWVGWGGLTVFIFAILGIAFNKALEIERLGIGHRTKIYLHCVYPAAFFSAITMVMLSFPPASNASCTRHPALVSRSEAVVSTEAMVSAAMDLCSPSEVSTSRS